MKIRTLIENTSLREDLCAEHGLSLWIETGEERILFDSGQSGAFADNAAKMGVDLSQVDFAVLSHGHYDHGGGLPRFLALNSKAPVYVQRSAFEPHYHGIEKYIGLPKELEGSDRLRYVDEDCLVSRNAKICRCADRELREPIRSYGLEKMQNGCLLPDDFQHEQYLLLEEAGKRVLFSGCSHRGILNIMSWFAPDVLIGGFHFVKLDPEGEGAAELSRAAQELLTYPTQYYTCHCTGLAQYEFLKKQMGDRLNYLSAGSCIEI